MKLSEAERKANHAARQRAWRAKNPERVKRYKKNWETANRERHLEWKREANARQMEANPARRARHNQHSKLRMRRLREHYKNLVKAWRAKNRTAWNEHCRKYTNKKRYGNFADANEVLKALKKEIRYESETNGIKR